MQQFLTRFSPLFVFRVHGNSMSPVYRNGESVLALRFIYLFKNPQKREVVIARDPRDGKLLIKRIIQVKQGKIFLSGDNQAASTDSREFGMIDRSALVGKVIYKL